MLSTIVPEPDYSSSDVEIMHTEATPLAMPATMEQFFNENMTGPNSLWSREEATGKVSEVLPPPLAPEPIKPTRPARPVREQHKPVSFEDVLGQAPTNSVEYRLHQGKGAELTMSDIERRVDYLQRLKGRELSAAYKMAAIAYLQEELGKRRRGE